MTISPCVRLPIAGWPLRQTWRKLSASAKRQLGFAMLDARIEQRPPIVGQLEPGPFLVLGGDAVGEDAEAIEIAVVERGRLGQAGDQRELTGDAASDRVGHRLGAAAHGGFHGVGLEMADHDQERPDRRDQRDQPGEGDHGPPFDPGALFGHGIRPCFR